MKVLILGGGKGTRLWPLSRENFPKQFIRLFSEHSLFQETVKRALELADEKDIFVITGEKYEWLVKNELEELGKSRVNIIVEPEGRNTAPAIALGVKKLMQLETPPSESVLVLPSDHLIKKPDVFIDSVKKAEKFVKKGYIVLFGEEPSYPETGYGYIKLSQELSDNIHEVEKFEEKPDYELAKKYVSEGKYLWNCGIFFFSLERIVKDFERLLPEVPIRERYEDFIKKFGEFPEEPFDKAILERTSKLAVVKVSMEWSDVGSWKSVYDNLPHDEKGNAIIGPAKELDSEGDLLLSRGNGLIACIGLKDCIVVGTEDATLVVKKEEAQKVKDLVQILEEENDPRVKEHITTFTPFGSITKLDKGDRYKIRKITMKQGKGIPLRMHHHRTVHFIVLRGTAKVKINGSERYYHENESFFVPKSTPYKIINVGRIPLELIEVQSGEYLGEDDVETLE
ncbi:mannose-1-phosphate guanylyltransferase/mannose-6-phosphate isomerase [Aquifex sp.]